MKKASIMSYFLLKICQTPFRSEFYAEFNHIGVLGKRQSHIGPIAVVNGHSGACY